MQGETLSVNNCNRKLPSVNQFSDINQQTAKFTGSTGEGMAGKLADVSTDMWE